jgi:hypothetical protein
MREREREGDMSVSGVGLKVLSPVSSASPSLLVVPTPTPSYEEEDTCKCVKVLYPVSASPSLLVALTSTPDVFHGEIFPRAHSDISPEADFLFFQGSPHAIEAARWGNRMLVGVEDGGIGC